MISLVLQKLEALQIDLAALDPHHETAASDAVADMAVALREVLAQANRAPSRVDRPTPTRAAG